MKTFKFWAVGRNKNLFEEVFIFLFHRHHFVDHDNLTPNSKWYLCHKCGLIKVIET